MPDTQKVIYLCDRAGIEYRDYSGRGMCGDRCFAIVSDNPVDTILELVSEAVSYLEPDEALEVIESLRASRQDSMGLSSVIYWPRLTMPEDSDSDEESE